MHVSVLLCEAIEALAIKPNGVYVDATFGRGGHSQEILSRLGEEGRLIAFDRDPAAIEAGQAIADKRFDIVHGSFSNMHQLLQERGVERIGGTWRCRATGDG